MKEDGGREYAALYRRYKPFVRRIIQENAKFLTEEEREDLLQEVFESGLRTFGNYDPGAFRPWIAIIARRRIADTWYRISGKKKGRRIPFRPLYVQMANMDALYDENAVDVLSALVFPDDDERVMAAWRSLPATERETVRLRIFDGLSTKKIAETMQVSRSTVHDRLTRAIGKLRDILSDK